MAGTPAGGLSPDPGSSAFLSFAYHSHVSGQRADGILEFPDKIYVIELKLDKPEKAIQQIRNKKYHEPYLGSGKKVFLLGIGYLNRETDYILEEIIQT